ncbi:hypothetical protein ABOM_001506 [Aspergillus bombycis]|uniref:Xaa-Pro dipeptidyl-peptidase C-terminal domain-containing protein n=1 Tax=Aspergillus bombycis TaxID=109264 RepID=A0A1F8AE23_9EURO|nr:hypothetical protein ABOM_001506 [Aspergillus bombycis]OGM49917.1 hypothetical protein ABOM_001506 [Aspergillus bombycis]
MTSDAAHASFLDQVKETKRLAEKFTQFRPAIPLDDPKARFPGFRQRVVSYKAGQQVKDGAKPLPVDIVMHESVAMTLSDGIKLFCDVFLPATSNKTDFADSQSEKIPALVAWSPYSKQGGVTMLDDFPFRAGVPSSWVSGLQKWEGPDPAYWCEQGYAIVNVDARGAYTSEGDLIMMGHQEAQDGAEFITWVSEQPWCSGKVALTGNSWLAMSQWKIASLRPKGLCAITPWEGLTDAYRDCHCPGGIPSPGFHHWIVGKILSSTRSAGKQLGAKQHIINGDTDRFSGRGRVEDVPATLKAHSFWNEYWEDKKAKCEQINVPTYLTATWTNPIHTPGTFRAYRALPDSTPKWLRVHNTQEWSDYYSDPSTRDLKRFLDHFLKGRVNNGWLATPKVRISVLNLGLSGLEDTTNRPESEFPLARTTYKRLFLTSDGLMTQDSYRGQESSVSYDSQTGSATFRFPITEEMETTGYFLARLVVSCSEGSDMDLFVQMSSYHGKSASRQGSLTIRPPSLSDQAFLKSLHDWHTGMERFGMLFHWGSEGQLRTFLRDKVEKGSVELGLNDAQKGQFTYVMQKINSHNLTNWAMMLTDKAVDRRMNKKTRDMVLHLELLTDLYEVIPISLNSLDWVLRRGCVVTPSLDNAWESYERLSRLSKFSGLWGCVGEDRILEEAISKLLE